MEAAKAIPEAAKVVSYQSNIILPLVLPLILSWGIYWLFKIDHKIERKDE